MSQKASVELGEAYVGGLRGFRQRRRQAAGGERALDRRVLEYEVQRLLELRKEADDAQDASLTDSLAYAHLSKGMRRALPKVGTRTRSPRARGDDHAGVGSAVCCFLGVERRKKTMQTCPRIFLSRSDDASRPDAAAGLRARTCTPHGRQGSDDAAVCHPRGCHCSGGALPG